MDREIDLRTRRLRSLKRILPAVIGSAVLFVGAGASLQFLRPSIERKAIRTARVTRGPLEATFEASGTVVPAFEKALSSPIEARILHVVLRPGAVVHEGDEILELDTTAARLDVERLADQLAQKRSQQLQSRLQLERDLEDLESRIEQQKLDVEILRYKAEQSTALRRENLISDESLRQADVALRKAVIELSQLQQKVANTRRANAAQLRAFDLDLTMLSKDLAESRRQLELATTRSDRDGVVTWVPPEEGATVRRGEVLARIADLSSFRVEATVSDIHAPSLRPGMTVRVRDQRGNLEGVVSSIDPTIKDGVVRFFIDLENPSASWLRNNLRVDVYAVIGSRTNILKLATGPWLNDENAEKVFVIRGDRAVRVPIRTGLAGPDAVEILEGLNEGDEVIVSDMKDYLTVEELRLK